MTAECWMKSRWRVHITYCVEQERMATVGHDQHCLQHQHHKFLNVMHFLTVCSTFTLRGRFFGILLLHHAMCLLSGVLSLSSLDGTGGA